MLTGDPIILGALLGLGILLFAWLLAILSAGDVEDGTERVFSVLSGILLTIAAIGVVIIGELTAFVGEAPGMVATFFAGTLGWLSLSGLVDVGPQLFATLVAIAIIGAIAIREA